METLPDYIANDLRILSIGLNPSPNSVATGVPFATLQNRFWRAFNASQLLTSAYAPTVASMRLLLNKEKIGFTDVVKRATPGAASLRAADYRAAAPILLSKIERIKPRVLWFHGKIAYRQFLRHALDRRPSEIAWGAQATDIVAAQVFVSPNPSAANAVYSLTDLIASYDDLARFGAAF